MTDYVALLRAVNVGGTGKLSMANLRRLAEALGFGQVRTHIASGNLLFSTDMEEATVKALIEERLAEHMGKAVPVFVRSAAEMVSVVAVDPFPDAHRSRHLVYFLDAAPPASTIAETRDVQDERMALGVREIYIDYGDNIRHTRLKLPKTIVATGRSINTVRKLAAMLAG
jgi:uncharacterized protein (DUF1697 family)